MIFAASHGARIGSLDLMIRDYPMTADERLRLVRAVSRATIVGAFAAQDADFLAEAAKVHGPFSPGELKSVVALGGEEPKRRWLEALAAALPDLSQVTVTLSRWVSRGYGPSFNRPSKSHFAWNDVIFAASHGARIDSLSAMLQAYPMSADEKAAARACAPLNKLLRAYLPR